MKIQDALGQKLKWTKKKIQAQLGAAYPEMEVAYEYAWFLHTAAVL